MAVKLEFVNLIIPIKNINNSKFEGGFQALIDEHRNSIGYSVWFDKHLFRIGSMDTWFIDGEINFWIEQGLTPLKKIDGVEHWCDLFAYSSGFNQFIPNCDWIEINNYRNIAWLKGEEIGEIYPNHMYLSNGITSFDVR